MNAARAEVIGRDEELHALVSFLEASDALPGAILLEGEAGIGKTTLWRRGLELASPALIACCHAGRPGRRPSSPSQASATCSSTSSRTFSRAPEATGARARGRASSRGRRGPPPDQRAIALAFLGALRALCRTGPVAVAVDDVQWLDAPSAFVLGFALRRLREEPVAFLLRLRSGEEPAPLGLDERSARRSGSSASRSGRSARGAPPPPERSARARALASRSCAGSTSSRVETRSSRSSSGARSARGVRLEPGESLPGRSRRWSSDRLAALPAETRAVLLAASALSQPTLELVGRAAGDGSRAAARGGASRPT